MPKQLSRIPTEQERRDEVEKLIPGKSNVKQREALLELFRSQDVARWRTLRDLANKRRQLTIAQSRRRDSITSVCEQYNLTPHEMTKVVKGVAEAHTYLKRALETERVDGWIEYNWRTDVHTVHICSPDEAGLVIAKMYAE